MTFVMLYSLYTSTMDPDPKIDPNIRVTKNGNISTVYDRKTGIRIMTVDRITGTVVLDKLSSVKAK